MTTDTRCEHCHVELGATDIAEPNAGEHRCKRCGGRALHNYDAVAALYAD